MAQEAGCPLQPARLARLQWGPGLVGGRRLESGSKLAHGMVKPVVCAHLRAGGMIAGELRQGIRRRGYDAMDDVRNAMLEAAGRIDVISRENEGEASNEAATGTPRA